ncbi:MAG TPA: ABC transporter substrate-binding protein [Pseudonocardia sp.]|nr:ABC transporter substrate-binding protein [Pseudonocardia sp.]
MSARLRPLVIGLLSAVLLTACGAGGSGAPSSDSGSALPTPARDEALAKMVPPAVTADGKLVIGTNPTYPPNEFTDTDGQTIIGFDADMGKAVAAKLGLTAEFQNSTFNAIIPGIQSGKYEAGLSSFFVNPERLKSVDMVSFFNVGTHLGVLKGNPEKLSLDNLCGHNVGVELGTVQVDDLTARNKTCTDTGKPPINVTSLQDQSDVTLALTARRISAMLADGPVVVYAQTSTGGQIEVVGPQYAATQYGIVIAKNSTQLGPAIEGAVNALIKDGTYQAILAKWKLSEGAVAAAKWQH